MRASEALDIVSTAIHEGVQQGDAFTVAEMMRVIRILDDIVPLVKQMEIITNSGEPPHVSGDNVIMFRPRSAVAGRG